MTNPTREQYRERVVSSQKALRPALRDLALVVADFMLWVETSASDQTRNELEQSRQYQWLRDHESLGGDSGSNGASQNGGSVEAQETSE